MNRIVVVVLLLCISSCNLISFKSFNVQKLRQKFQMAALDDLGINRLYVESKITENNVTGNVDADIPTASDWANHPFKDYLAYWTFNSFTQEYNYFLFSLSGRSSNGEKSFRLPVGIIGSDVRSSRIKLTLAEQEYVDQHPHDFLELLDETMLKRHCFWPYIRISKFDCAGLGMPKTKFLGLVENDPRYSTRVPLDYFQSRRGREASISKFSDWRK